jgi:hypothetical protein
VLLSTVVLFLSLSKSVLDGIFHGSVFLESDDAE